MPVPLNTTMACDPFRFVSVADPLLSSVLELLYHAPVYVILGSVCSKRVMVWADNAAGKIAAMQIKENRFSIL